MESSSSAILLWKPGEPGSPILRDVPLSDGLAGLSPTSGQRDEVRGGRALLSDKFLEAETTRADSFSYENKDHVNSSM